MAVEMRLWCDRCERSDDHMIDTEDPDLARAAAIVRGWKVYVPSDPVDLCPVCAGTDPGYFTTEPF